MTFRSDREIKETGVEVVDGVRLKDGYRTRTTLFDLSVEVEIAGNKLLAILDENEDSLAEGAINEALNDFNVALEKLENKTDAFVEFMQYLEERIKLRNRQAEAKWEEAKSLGRMLTHLKKYAVKTMEATNQKKVEGKEWAIHHHVNSTPTLVGDFRENEDLLPPRFFIEVTTRKLDTTKLRNELKNGQPSDVPPHVARIERNGHIRIKGWKTSDEE